MILLFAAGALVVAALAAGWRARRHWLMVTVRGESMLPALLDGDKVLVRRCVLSDLSVGDIVVFHAPRHERQWVTTPETIEEATRALLVKRVAAIRADALYVLGDNGGQDSRTFGDLPAAQLVGVVARRLPRR